MTTTKTLPMQVRHQNCMLSPRSLAGVPTFKPVNESILFCATALQGVQRSMELARLAKEADRDVICANWANAKAKQPSGYTVVLRDVLSVDVLSDCSAYTWGEKRLALVSAKEKLTIWVGDRGLLQRGQGLPEDLAQGAKLATTRIRAAAEGRQAELLEDNRFMPLGGEWTVFNAPNRRTGSPVLTSQRAPPAIIMVTADVAPDPGGVGVLRRVEDVHHQR